MDNETLIALIQDALGTAETGAYLVEVARDAHKAEMRLAMIIRGYEACRYARLASVDQQPSYSRDVD